MSKRYEDLKKGDVIKIKGEKVRVDKVTRTEGGEVRIAISGVNSGSHYQEIHDPKDQVK